MLCWAAFQLWGVECSTGVIFSERCLYRCWKVTDRPGSLYIYIYYIDRVRLPVYVRLSRSEIGIYKWDLQLGKASIGLKGLWV